MIDAIKNKKLDVVNKILKYDINIDRNGYTSLMWAAEKGYLEIVKTLLAHNANIDDVNGNTALLLASKYNHSQIKKIIIQVNSLKRENLLNVKKNDK